MPVTEKTLCLSFELRFPIERLIEPGGAGGGLEYDSAAAGGGAGAQPASIPRRFAGTCARARRHPRRRRAAAAAGADRRPASLNTSRSATSAAAHGLERCGRTAGDGCHSLPPVRSGMGNTGARTWARSSRRTRLDGLAGHIPRRRSGCTGPHAAPRRSQGEWDEQVHGQLAGGGEAVLEADSGCRSTCCPGRRYLPRRRVSRSPWSSPGTGREALLRRSTKGPSERCSRASRRPQRRLGPHMPMPVEAVREEWQRLFRADMHRCCGRPRGVQRRRRRGGDVSPRGRRRAQEGWAISCMRGRRWRRLFSPTRWRPAALKPRRPRLLRQRARRRRRARTEAVGHGTGEIGPAEMRRAARRSIRRDGAAARRGARGRAVLRTARDDARRPLLALAPGDAIRSTARLTIRST